MSVTGNQWGVANVGWDIADYDDSDVTTPLPKIVVGQNKIHAVWILFGDIFYAQTDITDIISENNTLNNFGEWDIFYNLSETALDSTDPDIVVDSRDIAYIAWADKIDATSNPGGNYRVAYARFNPAANQLSRLALSDASYPARKPALSLDNMDMPALVWQQNTGTDQIYFLKSYNRENVNAWTFPKNISDNSNNNRNADVSCDAKGYCYTVWENGTEIYYSNSTNLENNTWTNPEKISQASGTAKNPAISIDEVRNSVHIAWESNVSSNYEIYHLQKETISPSTNRIAKMTTNKGVIKILLLEEELPNTTQNFIELVNEDFYDGLTFHRYGPTEPTPIQIIQGGDPSGNGTGGSGQTIPLEISSRFSFDRPGMVGMARTNVADSATSQFFFTLGDLWFLDGQYSLFAVILSGGDVLQSLRAGDTITDIEIINQ